LIVVGDILGAHDVRRDREHDLVFAAVFFFLSEQVFQNRNLGEPGITA
jgi:hypothetical protein